MHLLLESKPLYTFTAPTSAGTYTVHVPVDWQFNCGDAQTNYSDRGEVLSTITVVANSSPTCSGFNYSALQGAGQQTVPISALCSDPDGNPFSITSAIISQGATGGTISNDANNIYFTPNPAFVGTDVITFTIQDSLGASYTHFFDMIISHLVAVDDAFTVLQSVRTGMNVLANSHINSYRR